MKHAFLFIASAFVLVAFSSCCGIGLCGENKGCNNRQSFANAGCETDRYVEKQVTEYVEEQVVVEGKAGPKGGVTTETITVKRPVVKTVREYVPCGDCGTIFCPAPDCCGIVPKAVLSRATAQGGTGEPHLGTIPTMKVLVSGAAENNEL
ncbi:MAG: hypothetical protein AAGC74_07960 [Verrucomicrobiota bacterium]